MRPRTVSTSSPVAIPQPVERDPGGFIDLNLPALNIGVPAQLLRNRPDIRQAERELAAAGLDVKVARAHFFPRLDHRRRAVGYRGLAFNPKYLFYDSAILDRQCRGRPGHAVDQQESDPGRLHNRERQAIAGRLQLPARNPQRLHRGSHPRVQGAELQQEHRDQEGAGESIETSVDIAFNLFRNARIEYMDVLFAQRDLWDARMELIDTKQAATVCHRKRLSSPRRRRSLAPPIVSQSLQSLHKKHFWHFHKGPDGGGRGSDTASTPTPTGGGPVPPPAPPAPEGGDPVPLPPLPDAGSGPAPPPGPKAELGLEPLPAPPADRGPQPPPMPIGGGRG